MKPLVRIALLSLALATNITAQTGVALEDPGYQNENASAGTPFAVSVFETDPSGIAPGDGSFLIGGADGDIIVWDGVGLTWTLAQPALEVVTQGGVGDGPPDDAVNDPVLPVAGDTYFDIDDDNAQYTYDGTAWLREVATANNFNNDFSVPTNTVGDYARFELRGENDGTALDTPTLNRNQKVLITDANAANERFASVIVEDYVDNTLYVDLTYGDDALALRERADRPFLTLAAADAAAVDGDRIVLRPGSYPGRVWTTPNLTINAEGAKIVGGMWEFTSLGTTKVLGYVDMSAASFAGFIVVDGRLKAEASSIGAGAGSWGLAAGVGGLIDLEFDQLTDDLSIEGSLRASGAGAIVTAKGNNTNGGFSTALGGEIRVEVVEADVGLGGPSRITSGVANIKVGQWKNDTITVGHDAPYNPSVKIEANSITSTTTDYLLRQHSGLLDVDVRSMTLDFTTAATSRGIVLGETALVGAGNTDNGTSNWSFDKIVALQTGLVDESTIIAVSGDHTANFRGRLVTSVGVSGAGDNRTTVWTFGTAKAAFEGTYIVNLNATNGGHTVRIQENSTVTLKNCFIESKDGAQPAIHLGDGGTATHNPKLVIEGTVIVKMPVGATANSLLASLGTFPGVADVYLMGDIITNRPLSAGITLHGPGTVFVVPDADMPPSPAST